MRKSFIFALAAAGMLCSCSSEDAISTGAVEDSNLVPIQLGVSSSSISTRGTGTVGGITTEENHWDGQLVNVYMFQTVDNHLRVAVFDGDENTIGGPIFKNDVLITPTSGEATGYAKRQDGKIKYYPASGKFTFWGYRLDAKEGEEATPEAVADSSEWKVNFTIDGSQDVMLAKTDPEDYEEIIANWPADKQDRIYSAYSARNGVHPNLKFEHVLTRLAFQMRDAGLESGEESDLKIVSVRVKSQTGGELTIAYLNEPESQVTFNGEYDKLSLMKREGTDKAAQLVPLTTEGESDTYIPLTANLENIGEALLVSPGDESYELDIEVAQTVKINENGTVSEEIFHVPGTIKLPSGGALQPSTSYLVTVDLYGLEEIKINTTLANWGEGEDIPLIPEND